MNKIEVMDWYQIKKHLYYTHDDFVRDIIALHLKKGALTDIYNYICKTSLFSIEDRFKGLAESIEDNICNEIITLFLDKRPIIRWYLNSRRYFKFTTSYLNRTLSFFRKQVGYKVAYKRGITWHPTNSI